MAALHRGPFAVAMAIALLLGAAWILFASGNDPAPASVAEAPQRAAPAISPPPPSTAPTPDAAPNANNDKKKYAPAQKTVV